MTEHKKISPIVSASSGQNDVLLDIRDLTVEFWTELGIKQAINHLNLTIRRGEALGLVGEAGAGKTTTALAILRLLQPKVGRVISGTTALDVTIQAQILELIKELEKKFDTSLLMITHNLGIISELCRNVAVMYAGAIIEYGSVEEVFKKPLHPYTKGLLGAIPTLDDDKERLMAIRGAVADPYHLPRGCSFYPRCDKCRAECEGQYPPLTKITDNHYVACWCHKEG
jgi:oligopeptide/dipeptide ABC transporter, ATP-binding protein, C-terminal domain